MTTRRRDPYDIGSVTVLSETEQITWVMTPVGNFVVGTIPDARYENAREAGILARAETLDDARAWYRRKYGLD